MDMSKSKCDLVFWDSTGSTSIAYSNRLAMDKYDRVDFLVSARTLTCTTHAGLVNQITFGVYTASNATVTPTLITSATGAMGMTTAGQIRGAQTMWLNFGTHGSGVSGSFSIAGNQFRTGTALGQSTNTAGDFSSLATGGMATAQATIDSEKFATYFNATFYNTTGAIAMREKWYASTDGPSTVFPVVIRPKDGVSTTLTATVTTVVGAAWSMLGHISVGSNHLSETSAHKYVCIGINSCTTTIPVSAIAIRTVGRYQPPSTGCYAYTKTLL